MDSDTLIARAARAVTSLGPTINRLVGDDDVVAVARRAAERGHFAPAEDERLRSWFACYLTARTGLLETIGDLGPLARSGEPDQQRRAFVVSYTCDVRPSEASQAAMRSICSEKSSAPRL